MKGRLLWLIVMAAFILLIVPRLAEKEAAAQAGARLEVSPPSYNFGTIKRRDGTVKTSFVIKNKGGSPLFISKILTS